MLLKRCTHKTTWAGPNGQCAESASIFACAVLQRKSNRCTGVRAFCCRGLRTCSLAASHYKHYSDENKAGRDADPQLIQLIWYNTAVNRVVLVSLQQVLDVSISTGEKTFTDRAGGSVSKQTQVYKGL